MAEGSPTVLLLAGTDAGVDEARRLANAIAAEVSGRLFDIRRPRQRRAARSKAQEARERALIHAVDGPGSRFGYRLRRRCDGRLVVDLDTELWKSRPERIRSQLRKPIVLAADVSHVPAGIPRTPLGARTVDGDRDTADLVGTYRWLSDAPPPGFVGVNGRFTARPVTGVERFARNIVERLQIPVAVFSPPAPLASGLPGHAWEQLVLPLRLGLRRPHLWSPCNFGPIGVRNQTVTIHDLSPIDHPEWFGGAYGRMARLLLPRLYRRARAITTDSRFSRDRMVHHWGARSPSAVVVPCGVDTSFFESPDQSEEPPRPGPYVAFLGTLEPRKNLKTLIEAVGLAREHVPDLELVVLGARGGAAFLGDDHEVPEWVAMRGRVDDAEVRRELRHALCFAYPSLYEGFGLPPLEAMAAGALVVASDIPVLREVLGEAALLADPTDPGALADVITGIACMPASGRSDRRSKGVEVAASYSWEQAAAAIEQVLTVPGRDRAAR
jgi:glycosyltransferase involved in cell wall biosynthesis